MTLSLARMIANRKLVTTPAAISMSYEGMSVTDAIALQEAVFADATAHEAGIASSVECLNITSLAMVNCTTDAERAAVSKLMDATINVVSEGMSIEGALAYCNDAGVFEQPVSLEGTDVSTFVRQSNLSNFYKAEGWKARFFAAIVDLFKRKWKLFGGIVVIVGGIAAIAALLSKAKSNYLSKENFDKCATGVNELINAFTKIAKFDGTKFADAAASDEAFTKVVAGVAGKAGTYGLEISDSLAISKAKDFISAEKQSAPEAAGWTPKNVEASISELNKLVAKAEADVVKVMIDLDADGVTKLQTEVINKLYVQLGLLIEMLESTLKKVGGTKAADEKKEA